MKNYIFAFFLVFLAGSFAFGQRYAYVNTEKILDAMPEYEEAQKEMDRISEEWFNEIEGLFADVDKKRKEYEAEAILLPEALKKQREKDISDAETRAKEMQSKRFGPDGDLFMKREELIKPIQDKVFNAIQQVASARNFAFVFDKANQSNLLFADAKYDISDAVLSEMGIKVGKN